MSASRCASAGPVFVSGVLVVHDGSPWLNECLDALSLQTRPLDRLVIVDTGSTDDSLLIARRHARIRQVVGGLALISAPHESTFGQAVGRAVEQLTPEPASRTPGQRSEEARAQWLWLLHDDSAAAPSVLAELLDAVSRSPSVGVAGPKLVTWEDPSRLLELGTVITHSGRRVGGPATGEPDQGQHDHRYDVLAVSTSGMLLSRDVYDTLGGFDPAFGQFRDDLDLCWRAQLAGYRVVVAPRARMREAAASINGQRRPDLTAVAAHTRDLQHGRQVALARCSLFAAPLLAIWIALAGLASAAVLLLAKRPRSAWAALGDLGSLMTPWRPLAARWRSRGIRRIRRRHLRGLFASPMTGFGAALDTVHQGPVVGFAPPVDDVPGMRLPEGGPASEEAESMQRPTGRAGRRMLRRPGLLVVLAAAALAVVTWRALLGTLLPGGPGIAGGELLPVPGSASQLWHAWLDGWHGAGLGNAVEAAPYLPVLSAGAWVVEHLPLVGASTSPVGVAIAWLLAAAMPLSAWTAYTSARVLHRAPWPRAWAALAWASLATLTTAVAGGRVGAVVAHILLPCIAAGFVCAARRSARVSVIFGAAVALAVTGAFNPALGVAGALAALVLLAAGHGRTRLRAAVLLLVPIGLLGPWVLRLVDNPVLLLAGPGLTVWPGGAAGPWQPTLLSPGGPASYPVLLSVPILLAGLAALSWRGTGSRTMTVLAVLTAGGLALGLASPHLVIGTSTHALASPAGPVTVWAGTGFDLAALALVAAALHGYDSFAAGRSLTQPLRRQILVRCVAVAAVLGVAASMAMVGWFGVAPVLTTLVPSTPAVVVDQADGPLGSRILALTRDGDSLGYSLAGAEPDQVVRDLPRTEVAPDPLLAGAVTSIAGPSGVTPEGAAPPENAARATAARDALADLGVGFVSLAAAPTDPLVTALDTTAGMTRLGNNHGLILWRVLPRASSWGSSRLRLVDPRGALLASVPTAGDHARADASVGPAPHGGRAAGQTGVGPEERRLVVAEPAGWADHARATFAGRPLAAIAGAGQPTYLLPPDPGQLSITLAPAHERWRWAQLSLLLIVLYLAAPFGSGRARGP
jgi:GT2 family glycosyltransferase